jgi:hypothetical protein
MGGLGLTAGELGYHRAGIDKNLAKAARKGNPRAWHQAMRSETVPTATVVGIRLRRKLSGDKVPSIAIKHDG